MKSLPNSLLEYMKFLEETSENKPFQPCAYYNRVGDQVEVWWESDPCYSEQVSKDFSIQVSQETGKVVGLTLYCPKAIMKRESLLTRNDPNVVAEREERLKKWLEN